MGNDIEVDVCRNFVSGFGSDDRANLTMVRLCEHGRIM
jgi:hypothetical protein